jgi:hypothetical protein
MLLQIEKTKPGAGFLGFIDFLWTYRMSAKLRESRVGGEGGTRTLDLGIMSATL